MCEKHHLMDPQRKGKCEPPTGQKMVPKNYQENVLLWRCAGRWGGEARTVLAGCSCSSAGERGRWAGNFSILNAEAEGEATKTRPRVLCSCC